MGATERIVQFIDYKGISKYKFCKDLGFSNKFLDNSSNMGTDKACKILHYFPEINAEWLLTGDGEMLKSEIPSLKKSAINYNRLPSVITIPEQDQETENIEIVPVKLAAGYVGGGYAEEVFISSLPKFRLPYLNNGTFRCFGVGGHSMLSIQDEDWFVGRFVDNFRNFNEGKIHAVIAPNIDTLLIKRVFRHPERNDTLILRSDSNDEFNTYPDIIMPMKYIAEMWSYAGVISFKEPPYNAERFKKILSKKLKAVEISEEIY